MHRRSLAVPSFVLVSAILAPLEGNDSVTDMLSGARAEEVRAKTGSK